MGDYFLESLFSDIESLRLYTGIHPKVFGYRRLLSDRFPFAIYYDPKGKEARVWAALYCRRTRLQFAKGLQACKKSDR